MGNSQHLLQYNISATRCPQQPHTPHLGLVWFNERLFIWGLEFLCKFNTWGRPTPAMWDIQEHNSHVLKHDKFFFCSFLENTASLKPTICHKVTFSDANLNQCRSLNAARFVSVEARSGATEHSCKFSQPRPQPPWVRQHKLLLFDYVVKPAVYAVIWLFYYI